MDTLKQHSGEPATAAPAAREAGGKRALKHLLTSHEKRSIYSLDGNRACFDCGAARADWASVSFGVTLCLQCAGRHRGYGTHVSFVRSLELDAWSESELGAMLRGGNTRFSDFLAEEGCSLYTEAVAAGHGHESLYGGEAGAAYRRQLATGEGRRDRSDSDRPASPDILAAGPLGAEPSQELPRSPARQERRLEAQPRPAVPLRPPRWAADSPECMLCQRPFTLLFRRHHCRRCGLCVCGGCAPRDCARPIAEWGIAGPVLHCKQCVARALTIAPAAERGLKGLLPQ